MADSPKVSFVITGFNAALTVCDAITSALNQVSVSHEVVFVDDGSTDDTQVVVSGIADPRLRVVARSHRGRASALNDGVAAARGSLIAILDADDVALPTRAALQSQFLDSHSVIEALGAQLEPFDARGRVDRSNRLTFPTSPTKIDAWIERGRMPLAHPAVMFRRTWFDRVGGYDVSIARAEDFDLVLRGWLPGSYAALSEVVTRYRTASPFPSWAYWRREHRYSRAVHKRWRRGEHGPVDVQERPIYVALDGIKWAGQLLRHVVGNREWSRNMRRKGKAFARL